MRAKAGIKIPHIILFGGQFMLLFTFKRNKRRDVGLKALHRIVHITYKMEYYPVQM